MKTMEYAMFKEKAVEELRHKLGENVDIFVTEQERNNQVKSERLTCKSKDCNLFPLISMKDLYQDYQTFGLDWSLMEAERLLESRGRESLEDILGSWEEAKHKIQLEIVNYDWNRDRLQMIPHKKILDLAVICRLKVWETGDKTGSMLISDKVLEHWKIGEKELWDTAIENLQEEIFLIHGIAELLGKERADSENFYVMSNETRTKGAVGILRNDLLKRLTEEQGTDLIVILSSVHEILLLPDRGIYTREDMRSMVADVNHIAVEREEWLSEEVYLFRREIGKLELWTEGE